MTRTIAACGHIVTTDEDLYYGPRNMPCSVCSSNLVQDHGGSEGHLL